MTRRRSSQPWDDGQPKLTRDEARQQIAAIAQSHPEATVRYDGLGIRYDGVPGTGGGTWAMSYYSPGRSKYYRSVPAC